MPFVGRMTALRQVRLDQRQLQWKKLRNKHHVVITVVVLVNYSRLILISRTSIRFQFTFNFVSNFMFPFQRLHNYIFTPIIINFQKWALPLF
jgi:hypothetical protein